MTSSSPWRPIAEAPKDGVPILLYLPEPISSNDTIGWVTFDDLHVVVGWGQPTSYRDGGTRWQCGFCDEGSADTEGYSIPFMIDVFPTHWMPLPDPPTGEKK